MPNISTNFQSPILGGFESSDFAFWDGRRIDCVASTHHDARYRDDYALLKSCGIRTVRDSFRWPNVEVAPGRFCWDGPRAMLEAARETGMQGIWDLCHFGVPDHVDICAAGFAGRFADYAARAAALAFSLGFAGQWWCPINEISYWSHAAGDQAFMSPARPGLAGHIKRQLVAGFLAARRAILAVDPQARFLSTDPMIHVVDQDGQRSHAHVEHSFEACDMLLGRLNPELGGSSEALDILGVNYYADNQWFGHNRVPLGFGHPGYRPLRALLSDVWERYGKPITISETGAEGQRNGEWLRYIVSEVRVAQMRGIPVEGICLYPVMDYPGWTNARHCRCGLIGLDPSFKNRTLDTALAEIVCKLGNAEHAQEPRGIAA
jgi:hypothetical protein